MRRFASALAVLGIFLVPHASAVLTVNYDSSVTEWSASTPGDSANGIWPHGGIGGSNNSGFIVIFDDDFSPNIQVGVRAVDRSTLLPLPILPPGDIYVAQAGEFGGPGSGEATWTMHFHMDLRDAPAGVTISDFDLNNSFVNFPIVGTLTLQDLFDVTPFISNARLLQVAITPDTGFVGFDPYELTTYTISGQFISNNPLLPNLLGSGQIQVVPEPGALALLGLAGAAVGVVAVRRRLAVQSIAVN